MPDTCWQRVRKPGSFSFRDQAIAKRAFLSGGSKSKSTRQHTVLWDVDFVKISIGGLCVDGWLSQERRG